jgi:hypothetical protein
MVPFVFFLGVIATLAGAVAIAFGIPINEFGLGNTLILAGTTAASAGFIVLALGGVLRAIERGGRELPTTEEESAPPAERAGGATEWPRRAPVPPLRAEGPRERAEAPLARPSWSGAREELAREGTRAPAPRPAAPPLRAERGPAPGRTPVRGERPREPLVEPPRPGRASEPSHGDEPGVTGPAHEAAGEPSAPATSPERRRLFAWTRRSTGREAPEQTAEPRAEPNLGESGPRAEAPRFAGRGEDREERREPARPAAERPPAAREAQPGPEDQVEVLKSGTVGGMSYTLYTDGSIDAEFPDGKLRFASIEDLRRHLEERG